MSDPSDPPRNLRDRLSGSAEDRLGKALGELLESPLLTGALGRAFDAREKAAQAQEAALGALNLPSAADIERLTRRLRSVSQRLEGIEDGVGRLDRAGPSNAMELAGFEQRLASIERQLATVIEKLDRVQQPSASAPAGASTAKRAAKRTKKAARAAPSGRPKKA
jgi:chromosome segregation ATPase